MRKGDFIGMLHDRAGHLGASLGVVELTVALHKVFDAPEDKIVWDVGHQAYVHKVLTGRRDRMKTIRQPGGLSGDLDIFSQVVRKLPCAT